MPSARRSPPPPPVDAPPRAASDGASRRVGLPVARGRRLPLEPDASAATRTPTTRPPPRPPSQSWSACSSARSTRPGSSPSTSRRSRCGRWACRSGVLGLSPFAVLLPEALAGIGVGAAPVGRGAAPAGPRGRRSRGRRLRAHPGRGPHVPLQQPRRRAGAAPGRRGLGAGPRARAGALRWAMLAAVLVGFAFLTKYLQAYLVLPAFALTWLVAAPGPSRGGCSASSPRRRSRSSRPRSGGSRIVDLLPAASRPFIGGSPTNSALDLLLGLRRARPDLRRGEAGRGPASAADPGGGPGGGARRLRRRSGPAPDGQRQWGGEIAWLLPGAAIGLVDRTGRALAARPAPTARRAGVPAVGHVGDRPRRSCSRS